MPISRYDAERARENGTVRTVSEEEIDPSLLFGESQAAGASADPNSMAAQRYALDRIGREAGYASRGQLTPEDQAQYEQSMALGAVAGRGARGASEQQLNARGQGGADTELLYGQMGMQQDAQSRSMADAQMQAGLADRSRQLQASYSQLAQGMRGQSFNESMAQGQAADQASMFDANYERTVNNRNTERQHEQSTADSAGAQRRWSNEARYLTGEAGEQAGDMMHNYSTARAREQEGFGMIQDVVDIGGGVAGMYLGGGGGGGGLFGADDEDDDE